MQDNPAKCVVAEEFRLLDSKGHMRALLSTNINPDLPTLRLYDKEGLARVVVEIASDDRVVIALLNKAGESEIGLGTGERKGIQISDANGPGITMAIHPDGERQIDVYNKSGAPVWRCP